MSAMLPTHLRIQEVEQRWGEPNLAEGKELPAPPILVVVLREQ